VHAYGTFAMYVRSAYITASVQMAQSVISRERRLESWENIPELAAGVFRRKPNTPSANFPLPDNISTLERMHAVSITKPRQRSYLWLLGFLFLLIFLALTLPLVNTIVNTGTQTAQTENEGQCQFTTRRFYTQQEAFTLALAAQEQRSAFPFGGNYAIGSYTICYKNETQQRFPSPPAKGYDNLTDTTKPINATHSEQAVYNWLQHQFTHLSIDRSSVQGIYVVIFSQVRVCTACREDMISWQRTLRQEAGVTNVFLSIWDLNPGFNPATYPAGPPASVTFGELERVPIAFTP